MGTVVSLEARRQGRPARGAARIDRARTAFYFDLADPGTYLAAERVDRLFPGLAWVPASLQAMQGAVGARAVAADDDEVEARAVTLRMPLVWPERHPAPRPAAMRAASYAAEVGRGAPFVLAASRLAFCGGFDLEDPEVLAEAAAAAGVGLRECLEAAGDFRRDEEMARVAHQLVAGGAQRLPVVRVGRMAFPGEDRIPAASAAWRDPAPLRRRA
jgi:2-hydroxychromene-2-carboxylate isomerase